jgi:hypothetical protein
VAVAGVTKTMQNDVWCEVQAPSKWWGCSATVFIIVITVGITYILSDEENVVDIEKIFFIVES